MLSLAVGVIAVLLLMRLYGFATTFSFWNVRTYGVTFLDLRLITGSAESYARGYDPAVNNPRDPFQRVFNYPKVWYPILASGINESWTLPRGIAVIALFLISVCVFPGRLKPLSAGLLVLAMLSPASMLAFARVNIDMLMFALMTLSLELVTTHVAWSLAVLLIAILLKIIPILGFGVFLEEDDKQSVKYAAAALVFTATYFLLTWKDMVFIFTHTQRGYEEAYGLAVLPTLVRETVHSRAVREGPAFFYQAVSTLYDLSLRFPAIPYVLAGMLLAIALYLGWRSGGQSGQADQKNLRAFRMGALMYVGTFLVGNNWDYRLIFLLFTLPQLVDWTASRRLMTKAAAIVTLIALFVALWHLLLQVLAGQVFSLGVYAFDLANEGASWALFAGLAYLFGCSLPDWFLAGLRSWPGRMRGAEQPIDHGG